MLVPLTFRDKYGFPYQRDGAQVLYAKALRQKCELFFEDGKKETWGYPLEEFHRKVYSTNLFRRVHNSYLIKLSKVLGKKWLKALLPGSIIIPLSREYNKKFQKYLDRNKVSAQV